MSGSTCWGAPVYRWENAEQWAQRHTEQGLRAAYWPEVSASERPAFVAAARRAGLIIAEVGAWSNPLAVDAAERQKALTFCAERLALADEVGALCCVNIAGSLAARWDGPCAENFSDDAFDRIVETVRSLLDLVQPKRTFYTLELMPWVWPWDADSYLDLIRAIDRPRFAVHLDPANTMASPHLYFTSTRVYQDLFARLGPWIKSCHVKDLTLLDGFPCHLQEVPVLTGGLDLREFVRLAQALGPDVPLMLEHLPDEAAYAEALGRLRVSELAD